MLKMNTDQESLLSPGSERGQFNIRYTNSSNSTWLSWIRRNYLLLITSFLIASCLTVYIYLNIEAVDNNQSDQTSKFKPLSRRKPMLDHESIFSESGPSLIKLSDLLAHCIVALKVAGDAVVNMSLVRNAQLENIGSKGKTLEGVNDVVTGADLQSHRMILRTIKDTYRRLRIVSEEDTTKEFENVSFEEDLLPMNRTKFANMLRENLDEIEGQHADRGSLVAQHETLVWIDPLDATKEYSENLTDYVTLMACIVHKSVPIAGVIYKPFKGQTFWSMTDLPTNSHHHSPDLVNAISERQQMKLPHNPLRIIVSRSHAGQVKSTLQAVYGSSVDIVSAGGSGFKSIEVLRGEADAYVHMTHIKKWDICAPHALLHSIAGGNFTDLNGNIITFDDPNDKVVTSGILGALTPNTHKELVSLLSESKSH